ncbi:MAG: acyltransferase domain-containing protein [Planctomycetes bacterium]|nr:acyltransferase domain-containing protein [Planctomycetota bacterium]
MIQRPGHDVAIVGMACVFPGAGGLESYWKNIVEGRDAISAVPEGRWDKVFHDPSSDAVHRLYTDRGGFIDDHASFDALEFGVMPVAAQASEPDQLLMLQVAAEAMRHAGYEDRAFPHETSGVILGRGGYLNSGMARLVQKVRVSQELVECLRTVVPGITEEQLDRVQAEYQGRVGHIGPDTVIGLVPNLAASRVANRLDLGGPAYTVDAACASSLIAVDRACEDLARGAADLVIAGGVHLTHDVTFWSVFCQLGALSRRGEIRPFSADADGLLIGEGLGAVVLKRLEDAVSDGDTVHAVIRASGVASDGREASVMNPRVDGQLLALQRAWAKLDIDPKAAGAVGMIEAHGTATQAGDAAELATVGAFFGDVEEEQRPVIGSVKSQIGHAMPAAGIAGLIKAAMSVRDGVLPPTLHVDEPHPGLAATRFRTIGEREEWLSQGPRRAAVNAFGFGGINAHVVLEEHSSSTRTQVTVPDSRPECLFLARESAAELLRALDAGETERGEGPARLALMDPTPARVAKARRIVERGSAFHGRSDLWFSPDGLISSGGKVAFLYPGVDADFRPRIQDVADLIGEELHPELVSAEDPSFAKSLTTAELEKTGVAIVLVNGLLTRALSELGVRPDAICGHSIGEWSGMIEAGCFEAAEVEAFVRALEPGTLEVPGVAFATAGCSVDRVEAVIADLGDVTISHDNCPHQVVACGPNDEIDELLLRLKEEKVLCQKLDFRSGFHSPLFTEHLSPIETAAHSLALRAPETPLYSATTCAPYPSAEVELRELFCEHLLKPVRFRELIERMHADGVRAFVQVGTGSLPGFVGDTLKGSPHIAIHTNSAKRTGKDELGRALAALWTEGAEPDLARLFRPAEATASKREPVRLQLGAPIVQPETPLEVRGGVDLDALSGDPVLEAFADTLRELETSGREVVEAYQSAQGAPKLAVTRRKISLESDPLLIDHSFFPQPEGWPIPSDRFPLVPMTMSIGMILDAARALQPGRVAVAIERVRAWRWMQIEEPIEIELSAEQVEEDLVKVSIDGYIEGSVRFADAYEAAPTAKAVPLEDPEPVGLTPPEIYGGRWMFHGPAYHAVSGLSAKGSNGMDGRIVRSPGEGALLDGAGQLFGLWISRSFTTDRMALPVRVGAIKLYGPEPAAGSELDCSIRITEHDDRKVTGDFELSQDGALWAEVVDWEDRRFESDPLQWPVICHPESNALAAPLPEVRGSAWMPTPYTKTATRDYFARRYLDAQALAEYREMNPKRQTDWLAGRVAAIDAVRHLLWSEGAGDLFPIEVQIRNDDEGRPFVSTHPELKLSIAHSSGSGFARVSRDEPVGVDLEPVAPRPDTLIETAFSDDDLAHLAIGCDRDEWITRLWCAKEARAKQTGEGITRPKSLQITAIEGETVFVDGVPVETSRHDDWIIAATS